MKIDVCISLDMTVSCTRKRKTWLKLTGIQCLSITRNTSRQTYERNTKQCLFWWVCVCVWGINKLSGSKCLWKKHQHIVCFYILVNHIYLSCIWRVRNISTEFYSRFCVGIFFSFHYHQLVIFCSEYFLWWLWIPIFEKAMFSHIEMLSDVSVVKSFL